MTDDFVSDDDKALFRDHMRSVKPLNEKINRVKNSSIIIPESPVKSKRINNPSDSNKSVVNKNGNYSPTASSRVRHGNFDHEAPCPFVTIKEYFLSDFISESVLSETVLSHCAPGVSSKRFRELKNGRIPWEARLDLHGLKTEAARIALSQFIQTQAHNNKRCLLIIHGKGGHQGDPPIIKNLVNRWLPQFDEVLAFHSAQAKDGGHGAVYVLLNLIKDKSWGC
jgi:DNA-nicking Smr family endonuclease